MKLKRIKKKKPKLIKAESKRKKKPKLVKAKTRKKKALRLRFLRLRSGQAGRVLRLRSGSEFAFIKKLILKISALSLIVLLNWNALSIIGETIAYYNDTEDSNANFYQAGTLDFYLSSPTPNFIPLETVANMKAGDTITREISIIQEANTNQFKYNIKTVQAGGNLDFCNLLKLEAKLNGETKYSDGLMNLNIDPLIVIGDDKQDDWLFTVTLPSDVIFVPGEVCQVKFVFDGSQTRNDLAFGQGFNDTEEINSSFAAGGIKINKVYYDVDADHGLEPGNEFIEIYNPLDNPVDISGWTIEDNSSTDVIPSSSPIPAKGFAIITGSASTWSYWQIPDDIIKIVLDDGAIGDGLDNDSDRVILKLPSGTIDDAVSYGTDTFAFDPACPDVNEGHMLARIPTGLDTNQASDWKDLGLPEITVIWPNGGEVLYVGRTYDLKWSATNPNGTDTDLTIDLWYSRDSGATWGKIATGTENDGTYAWRIPLYIGGTYYVVSHTARIKAVAWGPENFMVQDWDMSDADFCPPIDYELLLPEEIEALKAMGLLPEEGSTTSEEISTTTEEFPTTTEGIATTTEDLIIEGIFGGGGGGTGVSTDDGTIVIEETLTEETLTEETPIEELPAEETPIEEPPVIENNPTEEQISIDQTPAIEQEVIMSPQDSSSVQGNPPAGDPPTDGSTGGDSTISPEPAPSAVEPPPAAVVETTGAAPEPSAVTE
ncbi:MAG: TasA family protein [Candidatus Nealsonbacteria bacterium]|nr:TasA family protein [Candidatus Nealsonbacteria bacterium]